LTTIAAGFSFGRPPFAYSQGVCPMFLRHIGLPALLLLVSMPSYADLVIDPQPMVPSISRPDMSRPAMALSYGDPSKRVFVPVASGPSATPYGYASSYPMPRIVETGGPRPSNSGNPVLGWADQVPVDLALSQVVPEGWSIMSVAVDGSHPVSWSGGRPWMEVLSDLANRGNFSANVAWDRRQVVVYPSGQPVPGQSALAMARNVRASGMSPVVVATPCCQHTISSEQVFVRPADVVFVPTPPVVTVHQWQIDPHLSLRQNVDAWAHQAGWNKVVWEAADYEMAAPASFHGEFASPTGPLAQLIEAYSNSDQPLQVRLSTLDRVVHVTNKNYQPAVVTPLTPQEVMPTSFENKPTSIEHK
jgi:hypothetical protein